jgi:putative inorganic carbon (HCO3(-)) transporter
VTVPIAQSLPWPGGRPVLPAVREKLLIAFFVALAFSISASQILLTLLLVLVLARPRLAREGDRAHRLAEAAREIWADARPLREHPLTPPLLAFVGLTLLSALLSGDPGGSLWLARDTLRITTFYLVLGYTRDADHAWRLWTGFLVVLTGMAAYGLVQAYLCPAGPALLPEAWLGRICSHPSRVSGPFSIYMTFGGVLLIGILFFVACLANVSWRRVWWMVPAGAVTVVALAFTYSRNAWLGLAAGTLGLVATARRAGRALVFLAVGATLIGVLATGALVERVRSMTNPQDETIRDRVAMWRSGLAMIADHPVLGVGPGQVRVWYPHYRRPEAVRPSTGHLHNSPIQVAAERGLPAFAVWIWLWVVFFREGGRVLRRLGRDRAQERALVSASLAGVGGFLVAGLFEHNFGDAEVVMLVYALMAIPWIVARGRQPA